MTGHGQCGLNGSGWPDIICTRNTLIQPAAALVQMSFAGEVPFDQGLVRQAAALTKRLPAVDSPQFASDYTTVRCGRDFSKQPILRCAVSQWHSAGHALWPFFWHHPGCLTWQACLVSLPAGAQRYAADHPAGCSHKGHRCLQRNCGQGKEGMKVDAVRHFWFALMHWHLPGPPAASHSRDAWRRALTAHSMAESCCPSAFRHG